jgi:chromosome segregation ATPase
LRTEFYRIEKQATAGGAEAEKLRVDLELAHEANRALETTTVELSNEISDRRAQIYELEHQLTHETTERRTLGENHRTLQAQYDSAEKRNVELEGEIADMRVKLALLDDDKRSLQVAVDKGFDEAARLGRAPTESENALTATCAQLGKIETNFAEVYAERGQLAVAPDEIREQRQAEQNSLNMRLEGLQSRAATAERLQGSRSDHRPQQRGKASRPGRGHATRCARTTSRTSRKRARRSPSTPMRRRKR